MSRGLGSMYFLVVVFCPGEVGVRTGPYGVIGADVWTGPYGVIGAGVSTIG